MNLKKLIKIPFIAIKDIINFFLIYMPGPLGVKIRHYYYKRKFKKCGRNVVIDVGVIINGAEYITVGDNVHVDKYCIINAGKSITGRIKRKLNEAYKFEEGELVIGNNIHIVQFCILMAYGGVFLADNCTLSAGTKIYSLSNIPYDPEDKVKIISIMPYDQAPFIMSPVVLEENVWVGLNCIIMPAVTIGRNSFVRSNSLILSSFPENSYIEGDPPKRTRERFKTKNA